LLQRVRRRLFVRRLAGMVYWTTLGLSCAYLGLLLIGRLTGSFPGWFPLWSAPAVPALGCALALLLARRPLLVEAARAVDRQAQTQDLFLTLITLQGAGSDYQPLVGRDAERAAPPIQPQRVVPYPWERRALAAAAVLGLLLAASWLVPTLDPFGKMAAAQQADEALKLLEASKEATAARQAQLAQ
jgi:hypothetical protein